MSHPASPPRDVGAFAAERFQLDTLADRRAPAHPTLRRRLAAALRAFRAP